MIAYLATPYTKYPLGIKQAYIDASRLAARLMTTGVPVYSPIAHTHSLAIHGGLDPLDLKIWLPFDEHMMELCEQLLVAHMDGWQESFGVAHEISFFELARKAVYDLDPITLKMMKRGE